MPVYLKIKESYLEDPLQDKHNKNETKQKSGVRVTEVSSLNCQKNRISRTNQHLTKNEFANSLPAETILLSKVP